MGNEIWSINDDTYISKYYFTRKISRIYYNLVYPLSFLAFSAILSSLFPLLFPLEVEVNFTSLVHEKIVCFLSRRELGMPALRLAMEAK